MYPNPPVHRCLTSSQLKEPENEVIAIRANQDDESATHALRAKIRGAQGRHYGKKILMKFSAE